MKYSECIDGIITVASKNKIDGQLLYHIAQLLDDHEVSSNLECTMIKWFEKYNKKYDIKKLCDANLVKLSDAKLGIMMITEKSIQLLESAVIIQKEMEEDMIISLSEDEYDKHKKDKKY